MADGSSHGDRTVPATTARADDEAPADVVDVLLVDPGTETARATADALEREFHRLSVRRVDGAEAALAELPAVDCVVSAYDLPEGDALDLVEAIRGEHEVPFVLDVDATVDLTDAAFEAGVTDVVRREGGRERALVLGNRIDQIVGRRQVERRLERREQWFKALIERSPALVVVMDEDGTRRYVSPSDRYITGHDPEDVLGESEFALIHPADREAYRRTFDELVDQETGTKVSVEYRFKHADGTWHVHEAILVNRLDDPVVEGVIANVRDITPRKELEDERNETIERVSDAFFGLDEDWEFTYINERAVELILDDDQAADDVVGKSVWEVFPEAVDTTFEREYREAMETQESTSFEEYFPPLDTWFEVNAYPSPTGLSVYFQNVTDRKRMEADLRQERNLKARIFQTSPIGMTVIDSEGKFTFANDRAEEILGMPREQINDLAPDDSAFEVTDTDGDPIPRAERPFARVLGSGESVIGEELLLTRPDGEQVWLSVNGVPLQDEAEAVTHAVFALQDITDFKENERALEETVEKLQRSNDKLKRFAYITSHDLQEPLRMVSSYVQLLERRYADELDEDAREFIDYAVGGAERMREMINDLLEYSRIDTHGDEFESTDFDAVLQDATANLAVAIEETDAEIAADPLPTVVGDRNQLTQLLQNLVGNAIKYAGDEPPRIRVSADRVGDEWHIAVEDDGIGIGEDNVDAVFEVFKRLHGNDEFSGTGIGLAICQKIVERHDGRIWAESERGEGSTFYFSIPGHGGDK